MAGAIDPRSLDVLHALRRDPRGNRVKFFSDLFPYLLLPVLLYNVMAMFAGPVGVDGGPPLAATLEGAAIELGMLSGVTMRVTWGELLIVLATVCLFIEVVKSTSTASAAIMNHILSMLLFVVCLIEFLMLRNFATGTFFIITCVVLVDALAGMIVTIVSARRDFGVEGMGG